jgi:hypothetical protein
MDRRWIDRLKQVMRRNLPSQKPQLWEDVPLAMRRRIEIETFRRVRSDWMDTPHVVDLSRVGMGPMDTPPRMSLSLRDGVAMSLFLYGTYEIAATRLMQAFLKPGMTFVDVGAKIGYHSLLAVGAIRDATAVYAFEPNAATRARLEENLRLNGLLGRVRVRPEVVGRTSGWVSLSLDDLAATLPDGRTVDLIKIDAPGSELDVLAGARGLLARAGGPAILVQSTDIAAVRAVLEPHRYAIRRLDYTLARGLEFVEVDTAFEGIFDTYDRPSYFAVKRPELFGVTGKWANTRRSPALRALGRL